ncbi:MAG: sigma factor [Nocardioides sp.]
MRTMLEDLVQQALVKVVPAWKRISGSPDGYVRRVMVNESISRWRRHRGREVLTDTVPEETAGDTGLATSLALRDADAAGAPAAR